LSGVSLDGGNYFYTNPLAASDRFPYHMRWEGGRIPYISKSNCCPPNVVRTIAEINSYMYSIGKKGLYINMYGGSQLSTTLQDGQQMILEQQTNYPWQGNIAIQIKQSLSKSAVIFFRIPGWCNKYTLLVNGKVPHNVVDRSNGYIGVKSSWQKGDKIELRLDMPVTLLESNPLVEETRGQVTVKRGPIVYCLESADLPQHNIFDVAIPASAVWQTKPLAIAGSTVTALTTTAKVKAPQTWSNALYQPLNNQLKAAAVTLIPYYAWANRGKTDMTVWMPVVR